MALTKVTYSMIDGASVNVMDFGAIGNGVANDYSAIVAADTAASASGKFVVFPSGTFVINTSIAFTAPVVMQGGVLTGSGTVSFPKGFDAPIYYCFDCLVGQIKAPAVYAEWFGAQQSTATPTSTSVNITNKAWNSWPSFINGANFPASQNYGNSVYLAANKPFSNSDTWDFISIQRALWSFGEVTSGTRGSVQLLGGAYSLSRAIRYVGDMASTLIGEGQTKTILLFANLATHEVQTFDSGTAKCLLTFYASGPDPINISSFGVIGPSGYDPLSGTIYSVAMQSSNGITFNNVWFSTGNALLYLERSSNDIWVNLCKFEYGNNQIYGYDSGSWIQVANSGFWKAGFYEVGLNVAGYAFVSGCTLVSLNIPYILGLGSHVSSTTIIQDTTGYRTIVDGRTITRRLDIPAGGTVSVAKITMSSKSALTTKLVVGGDCKTVGGVGLSQTLSWYTDGSLPVSAVVAAQSKWGNATAQSLVSLTVTTAAPYDFSIRIANAGTGLQSLSVDATLTIEGADFVISDLI
jgi:hypothetical protein